VRERKGAGAGKRRQALGRKEQMLKRKKTGAGEEGGRC
jgi:hypothetical protein